MTVPLSLDLTTNPYWSDILTAAKKYNVNPYILSAQEYQESTWSPTVPGGIAQFTDPATAKAYGVTTTDPVSSINGEAHYMADLQTEFGSMARALEAYNAGPGNVSRGTIPASSLAYSNNILAAAKNADTTVTLTGFDWWHLAPLGAQSAAGAAGAGGKAAEKAAGTVAGPILAYVDKWALRAALIIFGGILLVMGLMKLTGGTASSDDSDSDSDDSSGDDDSSDSNGVDPDSDDAEYIRRGRSGDYDGEPTGGEESPAPSPARAPADAAAGPRAGPGPKAPKPSGAARDVETTAGTAVHDAEAVV